MVISFTQILAPKLDFVEEKNRRTPLEKIPWSQIEINQSQLIAHLRAQDRTRVAEV